MTCELAYRGHDCTVPGACLREAVQVGIDADRRARDLRDAQEFVVWPDSALWVPPTTREPVAA